MIIGVPKEVKNNEFRVSMLPWMVTELKTAGHIVLVETQAGKHAGYTDEDYVKAGADICATAIEVWSE